ncbi:hypothetical protein JZ751_025303 [Albula glossodonta]|uniref:Dynein light chain n=1 Tax=Albula glossodonta TaxID=121402 RepID=A0A8T2NEB7_9TELE|nr:hypothetical protein JZ751_025303 [Albula glossodonta]
MAETGDTKKEEADYKRVHSFPLIRHTDMPEEMRVETMELCVTACEKFATNNEVRPGVCLHACMHACVCMHMGFFLFFVKVSRFQIHVYSFTKRISAAKMIKESMDKKFGSSWHVVIGEGFGFEITHEVKNLLYMFFGGSLAVCVWKCS